MQDAVLHVILNPIQPTCREFLLMISFCKSLKSSVPRGSIYTTIMELGPCNHKKDGLLGPNPIMVLYAKPLGLLGVDEELSSHSAAQGVLGFKTAHQALDNPHLEGRGS